MTRLYWTDDEDDQTTLSLDGVTRATLGTRPPGVKPLGAVALYCQRLIADGVVCYGQLWHTTDHLGRLVTVCTRPGCEHVAVVPRVRMVAAVQRCGKCHRAIDGDNAIRYDTKDPGCKFCITAKNQRARERDRAKRRDAA